MKMKRLLSIVILAICVAGAQAQDVKVEFITPTIVHIVKGEPTKSLVVTAKPSVANGQVSVTKGQWKSKELIVKQDKQGSLTFLTAKGKVLLKEKECDVLQARQTFTLDRTKPSTAWAPSRTAR